MAKNWIWDKHGDPLRKTEVGILELVAQGHTNKEIAEKMFYSVDTIHEYMKSIFVKLGAKNRAHAVLLGINQGYLQNLLLDNYKMCGKLCE